VCDKGNNITVFDFLVGPPFVGGCMWVIGWPEALSWSNFTAILQTCDTQPFPGQACRKLNKSLNLVFAQGYQSVEPPQMGNYLRMLGLDKLIEVEGSLIIHNLGTLPDPRLPFTAEAFLPALRRVSALVLKDDNPSSSRGNSPLLTGLPGFHLLEQLDVLDFSGQGFVDLSAFQGLKCVSSSISGKNNPNLRSLAGLENLASIGLQPADRTGPSLALTGNPLLNGRAGLTAIYRAAGCPRGKPPSLSNLPIEVGIALCPASTISTWVALCRFIARGTCPPAPPAPPPPPPPPPSPPPLPPGCPLAPLPVPEPNQGDHRSGNDACN
jgi:hypothetical protein